MSVTAETLRSRRFPTKEYLASGSWKDAVSTPMAGIKIQVARFRVERRMASLGIPKSGFSQ